jgi:hypothetical protein
MEGLRLIIDFDWDMEGQIENVIDGDMEVRMEGLILIELDGNKWKD